MKQEVSDLANEAGMFDKIETACGNWQHQISIAIDQQLKKTPHVSKIKSSNKNINKIFIGRWPISRNRFLA